MNFREKLSENLKNDFDKETIDKIEKIINKTSDEFNKENPTPTKSENEKTDKKDTFKFFDELTKDPELIKGFIKEFKKPNWAEMIFKFSIAMIIIAPITYLSLNDVLGTCETATLFGGIVGYLLGELT
ncbi:hypothetical protein SAMN05444411_1201 [Lutibacter oricola]|uniref:Uncharacterized protein n=1 Tax=Lutibacter oricola TaxID=762486 RepID=A0A1H3GWA7_9FLAO|nr:hypothetical protein [Lutibacter oricola]SDY07603.1 hypothetical protein SAMN05444411_1201 [Lutibacter oricola]